MNSLLSEEGRLVYLQLLKQLGARVLVIDENVRPGGQADSGLAICRKIMQRLLNINNFHNIFSLDDIFYLI